MTDTIERATELQKVLEQSANGQDFDVKVEIVSGALHELQSLAVVDKDAAVGALTVLKKLMMNFIKKPDEPKFRKVRLANPTIKAKYVGMGSKLVIFTRFRLVDPADGAAMLILQACGFETAVDADSNENILVLQGIVLFPSMRRNR